MSVLKSMRWLVDTGADQHFCHSREQFDSYTQNTNMTSINTVNSPSRLLGSGTVVLQCILSNRKTVPLTLKNVIYLPTVPVNLFGAGKLLDQYNGHVGGRKLRNSKLEEFAQYDKYRLIIKAPRKYTLSALTSLALLATLEQAKPSLAL